MYINVTPNNLVAPSIADYASTASGATATPSHQNYKHLSTTNHGASNYRGCMCIILYCTGLQAVV